MARGRSSWRMFCPARALTAANRTTALPAVQVANVLSRFFSPASRAERTCQAPEAMETASQTTMPSEGGMVTVKGRVASGFPRRGRGLLRRLLREQHLQEQHHQAHGDAAVRQ